MPTVCAGISIKPPAPPPPECAKPPAPPAPTIKTSMSASPEVMVKFPLAVKEWTVYEPYVVSVPPVATNGPKPPPDPNPKT